MKKYLKLLTIIFAVFLLVGCTAKKEEEKKEEEETVAEYAAKIKNECLNLTKEAYKAYKSKNSDSVINAVCSRITGDYPSSTILFKTSKNTIYAYSSFTSTSENSKESISSITSDSRFYDEGNCKNEEKENAVIKAKCLLARLNREHYEEYLEKSKEEITSKYGVFYFEFKSSEFN